MSEQLLQGPVHDVHVELGATFAPFGGWEMPVSYEGTVSEHTAVRETVGLFDVSHLGKAVVRGPGAADYVDATLTNDLGRIAPGKAQYTLCCTDDGGVVDDLIAYYVSDEEVFLVPNAANTAAVVDALALGAPDGVTVTNQHRDFGVLAVQGPRSVEVLTALGLPTDIEYMGFVDAEWNGVPVRVCRSGYTGEVGYELVPRWADSEALFRALLGPVRALGGSPAGLGARDTLRTEMGYPLHGHELSLEISPLEARCGWAVGWKKPAFWGRAALAAQKEAGPARRLWGLKAVDRGVLRAELTVRRAGDAVGVTTSGTFSPTLKIGIALALLDTSSGIAAGDEVEVDVRGRSLRATVVVPPFVEVNTK
ncbi:glycine cleavage system aminomethyltransferase GcvT [Rhodococcus triatomae]|uniref:Aminomethyltransferase n=1 Tax=Rhodococcus triatomae TaxID=300028 RepID=A0A1G8D7W2_9NOCA|nr:glycine cleavage system aminomethyltransferase GcvT [Rhodococcus triatomae]QNG18484.1 glycine cleavage system aminomethyltransferase GcvT [Rhodococcus triatomae]QNG21847.1 glycine cleavage system aminomethyltransferase GcvT [Rhodococcus triatomae]SDH53847.1 aminomethyltransferase [Rhodococcus triatomae]